MTPTGAFTVSSPYTWNLSNLYTTGEVTLAAAPSLPGDFNHDGTVDAADYVVWRKTDGTPAGYNTWRTHFGQTGRQRLQSPCECRRPRTDNVGDAEFWRLRACVSVDAGPHRKSRELINA